jgi:hypothetical protein
MTTMRNTFLVGIRYFAIAATAALPLLAFAQESPPAEQTEGEEKMQPAAAAAVGAVKIARSALCLRIEEREPVDIDTIFPSDVGQVFAYTKIEGVEQPTRITHVWYHGGKEMARVPLQVNSSGWRTWSSKKSLPTWTGSWKVEVLDENGTRVKTMEFQVGGTTTGGDAG